MIFESPQSDWSDWRGICDLVVASRESAANQASELVVKSGDQCTTNVQANDLPQPLDPLSQTSCDNRARSLVHSRQSQSGMLPKTPNEESFEASLSGGV